MIHNWTNEVERIAVATIGRGVRTLGVISPNSASGVSLLCYHLAHVTSHSGAPTLLVDLSASILDDTHDGNIWRPGSKVARYSKLINQETRFGDTSRLSGVHSTAAISKVGPVEITVDKRMSPHGTSNAVVRDSGGFDILTARFNNSTRFLFANVDRLKQSFDEELSKYRVIIVDIPALNVTDGEHINGAAAAAACNGVLVVCVAGRTTRKDLQRAMSALCAANVIGTVVNDVECPSLGTEISREAARLERFAPRIANWLRRKALSSSFLNTESG